MIRRLLAKNVVPSVTLPSVSLVVRQHGLKAEKLADVQILGRDLETRRVVFVEGVEFHDDRS